MKKSLDAFTRSIDELLDVEPGFGRDAWNVRPVLVGAGEKERLVPTLTMVAGEDVRCDGRVRVADVGRRVDVIDRRGQVDAHCAQS
jgi:hypothetical protein